MWDKYKPILVKTRVRSRQACEIIYIYKVNMQGILYMWTYMDTQVYPKYIWNIGNETGLRSWRNSQVALRMVMGLKCRT